MKPTNETILHLDRTLFFQIGRVLQRGIGRALLGDVVLDARDGRLRIESEWGGGEIECAVAEPVRATVSAKAFCGLITTRCREKQPAGAMELVFRPTLREVAIDRVGFKARFADG
jgi:hypothetical protein